MKKSTYQKNLEFDSMIINGHNYIGLNEVKKTKQLILENNKEIRENMRTQLYENIINILDYYIQRPMYNIIILANYLQIKGKIILLRYTNFLIDEKVKEFKQILEILNKLSKEFENSVYKLNIEKLRNLILKLNNFQQF